MDQEKMNKSIKENKGILRQLTSLNNEIKQLKGRARELENNQIQKCRKKRLQI